MADHPLVLPPDFDPKRQMVARQVDGKTFHAMQTTARLAGRLAANGTDDDWRRVGPIVASLLECQQHEAPHRGNFRWEWEDATVEDLNAVQFALFYLIPIALHNRLDEALQERLRTGIALGLNAIRTIDVGLDYTNIVLKDIANSCLGGEMLQDDDIARRGRDKFVRWLDRLDEYGLPAEYNSPNYAAVAFHVLDQLARLTDDDDTRIRARTALWRLGLSAALRLHPTTGRWAGPFSRAYRPAAFGQTPPEIDEFRAWVEAGLLPEGLLSLLDNRAHPCEIAESAPGPVQLNTYHGDSFSLGVASQELKTQSIIFIALQSNVCYGQFLRPGIDRPGIFFSRYLLDDKWVGDFRTTPSRASDQLLPEEGRFFGVQDGARAIGLYAPRALDGFTRTSSAKTIFTWTERHLIDEIWVDDRPIDSLPADVPAGATITIASGGLRCAVRPLTATDLGGGAPIRLVDIDGHLALEIYNYIGPAKTFWELAHPGSFYQGQPRCGFYIEVAERSDWPDGRAFGAAIAAGALLDEAADPQTYTPGAQRLWSVEYKRDGRRLGIEVDLMEWHLKRRWTHAGELAYPMLESPIARQSAGGRVAVEEATLTCQRGPAWLCELPDGWVAGYHGTEPTSLVLDTPGGRLEVDEMGTGIASYRNGEVSIDAIGLGAWRCIERA